MMNSPKQLTEKIMMIVSFVFLGAGTFGMAYPMFRALIGLAKSFGQTVAGS